jgi:hypothetical protein
MRQLAETKISACARSPAVFERHFSKSSKKAGRGQSHGWCVLPGGQTRFVAKNNNFNSLFAEAEK